MRPSPQRTAIVTGVSRSRAIGAAIARRLATDGVRLLLSGWEPHDAAQPWGADVGAGARLAAELRAAGAEVTYLAADLEHPTAPSRLFQAAGDIYGPVDILVANHARSADQSLQDLTAEELDRTFAVNARSTLLLVQLFAEQHRGEAGRVVLVTSGQYHGAMPGELPYIASKAVLHELTPSLAVELAVRHISVNCVDPGPNDTGYATGKLHDQVAEAVPMGRWGQPADTANLISWLCGVESGWVTGQTIASDGGWSAR